MDLPTPVSPTEPGLASVGQAPDQQVSVASAQPAAGRAVPSQGMNAESPPATAAATEPGQTSVRQAPDQQASAAAAATEQGQAFAESTSDPQAAVASASTSGAPQNREAIAAPASVDPTEPEQASLGAMPDQQALEASTQPVADTAAASQNEEPDAAQAAYPTEPEQASVGQPPDQQASAASGQPAISAAAASQDREADAAPAAEECCSLRPHEQKVLAALLVVLRRAQMKPGGDYCMAVTKRIIMANNPLTGPLLEQLPDEGKLPSLKQLESRASCGQSASSCTDCTQSQWNTEWIGGLGDLAQQCATAAAEPLEVFTRSAVCTTHINARHDADDGKLAARLQRLQAIQASAAPSGAAHSCGEPHRALGVKVQLLAQHGIATSLRCLIFVVLNYVRDLLAADKMPKNKGSLTSGAESSYTICIDHMLPGVLDGLLQHKGDDLTSVNALIRMVPPLRHALQSYKDRAVAAGCSHRHVVMLEAVVQGWLASAPTCKDLVSTIGEALDSGAEAPHLPVPDNPASSKPTPEQEHPFLAAKKMLSRHCPDMLRVIEVAFHPVSGLGRTNFNALCQILPGFSPPWAPPSESGKTSICKAYTLHTVNLVKQQIQVHKHIASMQRIPLSLYLRKLLSEQGVDTGQDLVHALCKSVCRAADCSRKVDVSMARRMHISMCIKTTLSACLDSQTSSALTLLDKFVSLTIICAENPMGLQLQSVRAINQALPGVLDSLFRLHKWPKGSDKELIWLEEAQHLLLSALKKHAQDSDSQGLTLKEYTHKILAVPGLHHAEADLLVRMFEEFWDGQDMELAACGVAASMPHQETSLEASSASSDATPAASSTGAEKDSSKAKAKGAAETGRKGAEACELGQQSDDRAADVAVDIVKGASARAQDYQGDGKPAQDVQEAAEPRSEVSKAGKAEKRKAKKARQRAARAQAAAQTAEASDMGAKKPGALEGMGSAAKQEDLAELEAAEQLIKACHVSIESLSAAPDVPLAPAASVHSSEVAASSGSPSLSPQASKHLHESVSHRQQARDLPSQAAPAAQAPAPAAQDNDTWQEVRGHRRKSAGQQRASNAGPCRAPKEGRGAPDQGPSAPTLSCPTELQVAQHAQQTPPTSAAPVPLYADPVHEGLPDWLSALSTGGTPQHAPQREGIESPQSLQPQPAINLTEQHRPLQTSPDSSSQDGAQAAPQHLLHSSSPSPAVTSQEQAADAEEAPSGERPQNDDILCIVCMENLRNIVFRECGHLCTCKGCAQDIMAAGALCPICRASIKDTLTVYF